MSSKQLFLDAFLHKYPSANLTTARAAWMNLSPAQKLLIARGRVLKRSSATRYRRGRGAGAKRKTTKKGGSKKSRKRWSKAKKGLLASAAILGSLGALYGATRPTKVLPKGDILIDTGARIIHVFPDSSTDTF